MYHLAGLVQGHQLSNLNIIPMEKWFLGVAGQRGGFVKTKYFCRLYTLDVVTSAQKQVLSAIGLRKSGQAISMPDGSLIM